VTKLWSASLLQRESLRGFVLLLLTACSLGVSDQQWKLAESYLQQGQHLRAVEEYSRIVNLEQKGPMAVKAQEQIALIYEQQLKDYPRAIRALRDVYRRAEDAPAKLKARIQIAKLYSDRMGDYMAATEEYEVIFKEFGDQMTDGPELYIAWSEALMEASRFDDAATRLSQFQTKFPGHKDGPKALFLLAQANLAGRNYDVAIETFREIIRKFTGIEGYDSMVAESYYGLGMAFESTDDLAQALEAFRSSLVTYPNPKVVELKIDRLLKRKKERRL
jgi:tetratricopeptide (TPR) repeat protein